MKLRIKESMDQSIPSWLKPYIAELAKQRDHSRYGRDQGPSEFARKVNAATTTYTPLSIPRTAQEFNKIRKDPNQVTVIKLHTDDGRPVVWIPNYGTWGLDWGSRFNGVRKDGQGIDRYAAKDLIPNIDEYGYLTIDPEGLSATRLSRSNKPDDRRAHAQKLTYDKPRGDYWDEESGKLQGPTKQTWVTQSDRRGTKYDKSGYPITGIEKYKNMLAEMGVDNAAFIIDQAYDLYTELTSLAKSARGNRRSREAFARITEYFNKCLNSLENDYEDYLEIVAENPDYAGYHKGRATESIRNLREYTKKAKEFIKHVKAGDWTEEDFSNFAWRL